MSLFTELFCRHQWKSHCKEKYDWKERVVVPHTKYWLVPDTMEQEYSSVTEIFICEKCGKIKLIEY